ncbi:MAG: DUF934 domain-containing protein [Burkholderiaceae bacterium]
MPKLIDRNGLRADRWIRFEGDAQDIPMGGSALLPLDPWREYRNNWLTHAGEIGLLLGPGDDPADIAADLALPQVKLVAVLFPVFNDGRGYSIARLLRERYGWQGELRAVGDILRDQLFYLSRCGFDTFALRDDQDVGEALTAFGDFSEVYQAGVDRRGLFERRAQPEAALA